MLPRQPMRWLKLGAVFVGYLIVSQAGLLLATINQNASPFWPATGFAIFCTIVIGNSAFFPIALAAFLTNYLIPSPVLTAVIIAIGNTLEAVVGYHLFIAVYRRRALFAHLHEGFAIVGATSIGAVVSASIGVSALYFTANLPKHLLIFTGLTWFSGDAIGGIIVLPLLLEVRRRLIRKSKRLTRDIAIATIPLFLFAALFQYAEWATLLFGAFPLALLSLSYGSRLTALSYMFGVAITCAIGTWFTEGPFRTGNTNINLLYLVLFLFSLSLSTVVMISYDRISVLYGNRRYFMMVWLAAASITLGFELYSIESDNAHFLMLKSKVNEKISERLEDYSRALQSGVALLRASNKVTRSEWRAFAEAFSITSTLPGVYGIGYIQMIRHNVLDAYIANTRLDEAPDFTMKALSDVPHDEHFIIHFIEPIESNKAALGLDVGSETNRRIAAEISRDTGKIAMTGNIQLRQDAKIRPGFLLYSPVYKKLTRLDSVESRRSNLEGWVYAPFVASEFFEHALESVGDELNINIYDRGSPDVLWSNNTSHRNRSRIIADLDVTLAQRNFRLNIKPGERFTYSRAELTAWVSTISSILGLLAIGVLVNVTISRRRIEHLVDLRTREAEHHRVSSLEASRLASLGEMAGGIAHEINNPLAIIAARAENLLDRSKRGPVEMAEVENTLQRILEVSQRIAKIVSGMRRLVRDDSASPMAMTACSNIIEDALDLCREKYRSRGIELIVEVEPGPDNTPLQIFCRRIQVAQILVNLLNNAEHATEKLNSRWIKIRAYQQNPWIDIEITDSGLGISPDVAQRMMTPFFTTKEVGKGTGLGLAISRSIMQQHDGLIEYLPERSHTTFVLRFPIRQLL